MAGVLGSRGHPPAVQAEGAACQVVVPSFPAPPRLGNTPVTTWAGPARHPNWPGQAQRGTGSAGTAPSPPGIREAEEGEEETEGTKRVEERRKGLRGGEGEEDARGRRVKGGEKRASWPGRRAATRSGGPGWVGEVCGGGCGESII